MSFFQKLYEGKYAPIHEQVLSTKECKENQKVLREREKELRSTLTEEQRKLFDAYKEANLECEYDQQLQTFRQGFEIGVEFYKDYRTDHLPE